MQLQANTSQYSIGERVDVLCLPRATRGGMRLSRRQLLDGDDVPLDESRRQLLVATYQSPNAPGLLPGSILQNCTISGVATYGVFVSLAPYLFAESLIHKSELTKHPIKVQLMSFFLFDRFICIRGDRPICCLLLIVLVADGC